MARIKTSSKAPATNPNESALPKAPTGNSGLDEIT